MRAGLAENERFLRAGGRGYVGAHACFTLSEADARGRGRPRRRPRRGVHIHVAEDRVDSAAGARLEAVTTGNWLLPTACTSTVLLQGTVAHNPRSNMNNAVGYARPARLANTVVLGTDGIGGDMLEEFRIAYVRHREDDVTATPDAAWSWLENGRALVPETAEDRVRWSYEPDRPVASRLHAWSAAGRGRRRRRSRASETAGPPASTPCEVRARAHEQAERLWARL